MASGTVRDGHFSRAVSDIQDTVQRHKTASQVCPCHSQHFQRKAPVALVAAIAALRSVAYTAQQYAGFEGFPFFRHMSQRHLLT